ncbi:hypothetical protein RRF57_008904 [Xylaria bambusicola]|uniref:Uncharacterized protein n=1 Tax=Xylaria bambusicola TaxID=326684 RepID=A0AAN7UW26_9PEZI
MSKRHRIRAHAELRTPLLRNRLRHPGDSSLRHGIIDLSGVAVDAARRGDVHDAPRLAVAHAEVRRRGPDQLEGRRRVQVHDRVPLVVAHLVYHPVPRVPRVVHEDVQLAVAEGRGLLDQRGLVRCV